MTINDPSRLDQDVALDYELSIPRYAEVGGDTLRFLPFGSRRGYVEAYAGLAERRGDLVLDGPSVSRFTFRYRLPSGWSVDALPPDVTSDTGFGKLHLTYAVEQGVLVCRGELVFTRDRISASEYPAFRAFVAQVDQAFSRKVLVRAPRKAIPPQRAARSTAVAPVDPRLEPMSPVPEAPLRITIAVCAYVLLVVWVTLRGLDTGLRRSGCAAPIRRSLLVRIGALLAIWFLAVTAAAVAGAWLDLAAPRALGYLIPALALSLVLWRAGWLQAAVQALPPAAIPWLQTLRIGGGLTLFAAWASGLAPWGWVATAGTGDILVGLGAAAVAALLGTGLAWSRSAAIAWNVFGLVDMAHTMVRGCSRRRGRSSASSRLRRTWSRRCSPSSTCRRSSSR